MKYRRSSTCTTHQLSCQWRFVPIHSRHRPSHGASINVIYFLLVRCCTSLHILVTRPDLDCWGHIYMYLTKLTWMYHVSHFRTLIISHAWCAGVLFCLKITNSRHQISHALTSSRLRIHTMHRPRKHGVRGVNWPPTFSSVGSINVDWPPTFSCISRWLFHFLWRLAV